MEKRNLSRFERISLKGSGTVPQEAKEQRLALFRRIGSVSYWSRTLLYWGTELIFALFLVSYHPILQTNFVNFMKLIKLHDVKIFSNHKSREEFDTIKDDVQKYKFMIECKYRLDWEINMFECKTFIPRWNSETLLFIILLGLTLLASVFNVPFIYGITFSFTSIFIFILFRLFGLPLAILATLFTFLLLPFNDTYIAYNILGLLEILFVGVYFKIKKRGKMFFIDAFFWLTLGILTIFLFNQNFLSGNALYFQICKDILNGLFNVLIADMLLAYFPFYKVIKFKRLNKNHFSIHQFLTHITIISILIPLFLSTLTKTWNAHELISTHTITQAENSMNQMKKEILLLNKAEPNHDVSLKRTLDELVEQYTSPDYSIIITDNQNKVITSSLRDLPKYYDLNTLYEVKHISNHIYQALPKGQKDVLPLFKWRSGKLIFINQVDSLPMKLFIQFPNTPFQDQLFSEFLYHIRFSLFFSLFTIIFVLIISRLFMNNLMRLTIFTTDLPQKLRKQEQIDWPQSNISELRVLSNNLREMAQKLKELFQESIEVNRILSDQTKKLKESEDKLHKLAYYDVLTALPNRLHFQSYVRNRIKKNPTKQIAIIFIDLNKFKQINDTFGHDAGDTLLQMTAKRLSCLQTKSREVFRISGDEFVIVHEIDRYEDISRTIEQVKSEFSSPFRINGQVLYITVSLGVSLYPEDGTDLDSLVKCADIAMYVSKNQGGTVAHVFNESMRSKFQERLFLENSLRMVVEKGDFELFYQPKIHEGQVTSVEALLRWNDPILGNIPPSTFIPIAEETGLISKVDEWALLHACKQNKQWQNEHLLKVPISVNISAENFKDDGLVAMVEKALNESGLSPFYLKLEITESVFIKNPKHVADVIKQIKSIGVLISLDDFGKGYSSFNHLLQLPIDEVKIDRQFVEGINQNEKKAIVVQSIFDIAHRLQLNIVAEGVETTDERDLLIQMGCDELQGYLFSPPISKTEFEKYLDKTQG
jgi:diguanylate cyclase (GGDEF)-like protein